ELDDLGDVTMPGGSQYRAELRVRLRAEGLITLEPVNPFHGRAATHVVTSLPADTTEPIITESLQVDRRRPRMRAVLKRADVSVSHDELPRCFGVLGRARCITPRRVTKPPMRWGLLRRDSNRVGFCLARG